MVEITNISDFGVLCLQAAEQGKTSTALLALEKFSWGVGMERETGAGRVFSSRALDQSCQAIGALNPVAPGGGERRGVVYVVSELRLTGGHTRVVSDIIQADMAAAQSGEPVTILVTNVTKAHDPATAGVFSLLGVQMEQAPETSHEGRMAWLKERLAALWPRVTRLALHPFDSVAIAAVQPERSSHPKPWWPKPRSCWTCPAVQ